MKPRFRPTFRSNFHGTLREAPLAAIRSVFDSAFLAAPAFAPAFALALTIALSFSACGGEAARAREASRSAARTATQGRLDAAKAGLAAARDDAARTEALRGILKVEVMELGDLKSAFALFEENQKLLATDLPARVFMAVAQSMQAGAEKKIENKLVWLRKGMRSFDILGEEYPDNEMVYLYKASTYANFPPEVGAMAETLDILDAMRASYSAGAWKLEEGTARQLAYIYATLEKKNPGDEAAKAIRASRDGAAESLPALAQAIAAAGSKP